MRITPSSVAILVAVALMVGGVMIWWEYFAPDENDEHNRAEVLGIGIHPDVGCGAAVIGLILVPVSLVMSIIEGRVKEPEELPESWP
jgi:nitrogen fixation-related uncharacterized protein